MDLKGFPLTHIWLFVSDVARAKRFYQDILGFPCTTVFPEGALFDAGGVVLGIHQKKTDEAVAPGDTMVVLKTEQLDEVVVHLQERGLEFEHGGIKEESYGRVAHFKDPDGYSIELWGGPPDVQKT